MHTSNGSTHEMRTGALVPFFALTFALTWGLAALFIVFPETLTSWFGEVSYTNPLFVLAVYAPGIVGILLVAWYGGMRGVGAFLRRFALWRMPGAWWAFLFIGIPVLFYLGAALEGILSNAPTFDRGTAVFPALLAALLIGPIEELGWRGVALPLLQRRMAPIWAGLVLGAVWALWHAPSFMIGGTPQSSWSLPAFFIGVVALSVILTALFNAAGGSLLAAVLFHFQTNNPIWPDAQPWDTLFFAAAAAAVVWFDRRRMFSRRGGATDVVRPPAGCLVALGAVASSRMGSPSTSPGATRPTGAKAAG